MKAKAKWRKSPVELLERFDAVLPRDGRVVRRSMFGYPCAFANGNMFSGLHEDRLIVRLPEAERVRLLEQPGAHLFEPMPGRPMKEYVVVPAPLTNRTLRKWMAVALDYAAGLPAKTGPQKSRKARKA